ncbi:MULTISPECIES: TetR/AcrR family transcriptional regulator C-terminal ligand-binding domain-containing protein [Mesorhizobium]|nr:MULTISPECIES: TetR/AcrR family transcriptional regulator C-terminal ligand-binding domain-containing protein [Mesorhizobium]
MIYAPVFYRLLAGHMPLNREFADGVIGEALRLLD